MSQPQTVIIPVELVPLLQDVGGYREPSTVPFQRQFDAAIGVLLTLWHYQSPIEKQVIRRLVQESDGLNPENN